jgi:hypothetical protein
MAVCEKTFRVYTNAPYAEDIIPVPPLGPVAVEEAPLFDCSRDTIRHPRETKGLDYRARRTGRRAVVVPKDAGHKRKGSGRTRMQRTIRVGEPFRRRGHGLACGHPECDFDNARGAWGNARATLAHGAIPKWTALGTGLPPAPILAASC